MKKNRKEKPASWYNQQYEINEQKGLAYTKPAIDTNKRWYDTWVAAIGIIKKEKYKNVVDFGCGCGHFIELATQHGIKMFGGYDFSSKAIEMAKKRLAKYNFTLSVIDITKPNELPQPKAYQKSIVTMFEVIEHIKDDLKVFEYFLPGQRIIFGIPNYDNEAHVRYFLNDDEIHKRYSKLLDIKQIITINSSETNKVIYLIYAIKKKRLKIYYQYANTTTLIPKGGDYTNEIGMCKALSQFVDVYYAGKLFHPDKTDYGLNSPVTKQIKDCDVVMSRASKDIVNNAGNKPVVLCTAPYDHELFKKANILYCMSNEWANMLKTGKTVIGLNPYGYKYPNAIGFGQVADDRFKPLKNHPATKKYRAGIKADFIIGMFGRLVGSTNPRLILSIFTDIQKSFPNLKIKLLVGSRHKLNTNNEDIIYRHPTWDEMPYAYNACDLLLTNAQTEGFHYSGSTTIIEISRCGLPLIMQKARARVEITGDYIGYIPFGTFSIVTSENKKILLDKFIEFISNAKLRKEAGEHLLNTSDVCTIKSKGKELSKIFKRFE